MLSFENFRNGFFDGFGYETAKVLMERAPDCFKEVTPFVPGVRVEFYNEGSCGNYGDYVNGEIVETNTGIDGDWLTVEACNGVEYCVLADACELDNSENEEIPAYFWRASDSGMSSALDREKARNAAAKAGFRVWETPDDTQISRDCTDNQCNENAFREFYKLYME